MSIITVDFSNTVDFGFFHNGNLSYFLPEICCLSEIQRIPSEFALTEDSYIFTMYLTYAVSVDFAFSSDREAIDVRHSIITALSNFLGPDKLVCVNGFDLEVAVVPAILDVTDVFIKDGCASFSATVDATPHPLNFIFPDDLTAISNHTNLLDAIEIHRQQASVKDWAAASI